MLNNKPDILLPGFFEGPEKLLEIVFAPRQDADENDLGLRLVPRNEWSAMLTEVGCEIVSTITSAQLDAYLLRCAFPLLVACKDC